MKITAVVSLWICMLFALACFGVAYEGFTAAATMANPAERELSTGYAGFWTFLGAVAVVFGVLSWMIKQGKLGSSQ